jgi:hypothetical protein
MSSNIVVLNPYTPLAFLPPDLANLYQGSCYVVVAGLSVRTLFQAPLRLTILNF